MNQRDLFGGRSSDPPINRLEAFCEEVSRTQHGASGPTTEGLAEQFRKHFRVDTPVSLNQQFRLAKRLGIQRFALADLPKSLSGFNEKRESLYTLLVNRLDHRVRQEHTVFHEVFELIHRRLEEIQPQYRKPPPERFEHDADEFAANLFMPPESFLRDMLDTGLDILELQRRYKRAYSSTLIQMAQTLRRSGIPFLGLLYERKDDVAIEPGVRPIGIRAEDRVPAGLGLRYRWAVSGLSHRIDPVLASHLPDKGDLVVPGTLARLALKHRRPVYIERATGFDFFGLGDLTLFIRPVVWRASAIAKIIITAVRFDQRELFEPQLAGLDCQIIDAMRGLHTEWPAPSPQLWLPLALTPSAPGNAPAEVTAC